MSVAPVPVERTSPAVPTPAANTPAPRAVIDYDFLTVLAAPPKQRLMLWLMLALVIAATIGLAVAKVDVVVRANGQLAPTASAIVVQPLETSVVRRVLVKMGDKVRKGQVLAVLDPTFSEADEAEIAAKLNHLDATYNRLSAELAGRPYAPAEPTPDQATQREVWRKRQAEYAARIASSRRKVAEYVADLAAHKIEATGLKQQIALATNAQAIYRQLVDKNLASKLRLIDTTQRLVEAKSRLATNRGEQQKLVEQIAAARADRAAFVSDWQRRIAEQLAKIRSERDGAAAQLSKARLRRQMDVLRAPADATVLAVADRPEGAVVRGAEPLFRLIPKGTPLVADIRVNTRDVARLKLGDPVTLKFEALPWEQFGLAHGVLKTLAPDTQSDSNPQATAEEMATPGLKQADHASTIHYRAHVRLTDTKFRNVPKDFALRPGMRLEADVKIGRRSILDYILNPVTRVFSNSLREP